jgi:phage host-nuclease inhibitor protein Gam
MVKAKAAAANVRIPQNREEAAAMIAEFGAASREIELIETAMNEELAQTKAEAEKKAAPHVNTAKQLFEGLKLYCEANRQMLLGNTGLKTVDFGTGKVAWRWKPAKVRLSGDVEEIIGRILAKAATAIDGASYRAFLRMKQEVDKDGMLKNKDLARTIEGVSIGRDGEVFEIEPFGAGVAQPQSSSTVPEPVS